MVRFEWNAADLCSVYHYACIALFATEDDQHEKPPVMMVTTVKEHMWSEVNSRHCPACIACLFRFASVCLCGCLMCCSVCLQLCLWLHACLGLRRWLAVSACVSHPALEIYPCESSLEAVPCIVAAMGGAVFLHLVPKTWSCFWFRFRV